jgi:hypothetical protein
MRASASSGNFKGSDPTQPRSRCTVEANVLPPLSIR